MKKKEILIIVSTHGDERIGSEVVATLKSKKLDLYFDDLIANPKASKKNKRFIDFDLNRAYPGNKKSQYYEKRQAAKNLKIAEKYKYVIDLHEASHGTNDFIIVPREKIGASFPVDSIKLKKILLWPNPKGPLSQVLDNAIELEFGMKDKSRKEVLLRAIDVVVTFIEEIVEDKKRKREKVIYYVYGKLNKKETKIKGIKLKDFSLARINNERFCPLLVGQYLKDGIVCYKMKKI